MVPALISFMDIADNPHVSEIVFCKSAQIGGTDAVLNIIGKYASQTPCPIVIVLADQATANYVSKEKIKPMFQDSSDLAYLWDRHSFTNDEIYLKNGAYIAIVWASSVAQLATRTFRIAICDEVDKPGYNVTTKEANSLSLVAERTETYPAGMKKIIYLSTPTIETGNILNLLSSCDIVFDYHVPCYACGQYQPLRFSPDYTYGFKEGKYIGLDGKKHNIGYIKWEGGRKATNQQIRETSRYICGNCGASWNTIQKNEAVNKAKLVSRTGMLYEGEEDFFEQYPKVGFHVNRLYSFFDGGRLEKIVASWVDIYRFPSEERAGKLQGFINSTLAEPFKQITIKPDKTIISKAICDLPKETVPDETILVTAGIDVQLHGFWYVVRAWLRDYTSWMIDYGFLSSWDDVANLLFQKQYRTRTGGTKYNINRAAIDIGGTAKYETISMTEETLWWIRENGRGRGCRVWGTKGATRDLPGKIHIGKIIERTPSGRFMKGGYQVITIDTVKMKDTYHYRTKLAGDEGGIRSAWLHSSTGADYIAQVTAEEKRTDHKGRVYWHAIRKDNHLLDCEVLAMVTVEPEWIGGGLGAIRKNQPKAETVNDAEKILQDEVEKKSRTNNFSGRIINPWKHGR